MEGVIGAGSSVSYTNIYNKCGWQNTRQYGIRIRDGQDPSDIAEDLGCNAITCQQKGGDATRNWVTHVAKNPYRGANRNITWAQNAQNCFCTSISGNSCGTNNTKENLMNTFNSNIINAEVDVITMELKLGYVIVIVDMEEIDVNTQGQ